MKPKTYNIIKEWLAWLLVVPATMLSLIVGLCLMLKLWRDRLPWKPDILPPDLDELDGLTEAEAALRRSYDPEEENKRARKEINTAIFRRNLISIFNISLLGLAIVTFLLEDVLGALTTLGVLLANVVINTVQQAFAVYNVEKIAGQSHPKVNVIRSGESRGIRIDEIVIGDVLVVGLGDQILANGQVLRAADNFLVNDKVLAETGKGSRKKSGDGLQAGSYCVAGWAAYAVDALPAKELRTTQLNAVPETRADLTPLQKIIDQILRILLLFLAIFVVLLVHSIAQWDVVPADIQKLYLDAASIIFSIVPSGLFFMIIVSYNMGTFDLLKLGALVRDSRSVESLAQVTTICFGKSGTLTGIDVQVDMLPQPEESLDLGENRVRQIIGDFAHNSSSLSPFLSELRKAFDGQPRPLSNEMRFLSTYGWSALTFRDPDLQGTYVLGGTSLFQIETPTAEEVVENDQDQQQQDSVVQRTWGRLRGFFQRADAEPDLDEAPETGLAIDLENNNPPDAGLSQDEDGPSVEYGMQGFLGRARARVTKMVRREPQSGESVSDPEEPPIEPSRLVFAYSPEEKPLFDQAGHPVLPDHLIPLSYLRFTEQIRPEAKEAIGVFTDAGVQVNIISQQRASEIVAAARQLGLEDAQTSGLKSLSGDDIEHLHDGQLTQVVKGTTIFAPVTTTQKRRIIEALRGGDEYVAMTGEGLADIDAMRHANLSIAIQGGSQAAISFADIILLKDSLQALPSVLRQGRRIVNGLIDVLKVNLVQVAYIFFLLIAMLLMQKRVFFYDPTQGGLIVFFSIVIPSLGLTLWATSGAVSEKRILSQLMRFVIPVGFTSALASLAVYIIFESLTGDRSYAQLGVTYILSFTGMLMVLFIKPPRKFWVGESPLSGDMRFVWMVLVMFILFAVTMMIPLAQELLKVAPLRAIEHYLVIFGVTLVWMLFTKLVWLLPGLRLEKR
jgi:magnesium-transporting ATPase (P-type)